MDGGKCTDKGGAGLEPLAIKEEKMVNEKLLKETIVSRGVKISHVARELGITYVSMNNKLKGKHEITLTEALEMKKILRLTQDEWNEIFDAK